MTLPSWLRSVARLLPVLVLGAGLAAFYQLNRSAHRAEAEEPEERAYAVRVIEARALEVIPRAVGFGVARPADVWQAVAEVGGRVVSRHPLLEVGQIVRSGTVLVEIDRADYDLAVTRAGAQIESTRAKLSELETKEETLQASLELESQSLALARKEVERIRGLVERKTASPSDLDREERTALSQRARVLDIENSLRLIPSERAVLEAQLRLDEARLAEARLSVARTTIKAPFDCRIARVEIEKDQVASAGQVLATADSIDGSEVTGHFPMDRVLHLMPDNFAIDPATTDPAEIAELFRLKAEVRLVLGTTTIRWKAEFVRHRGIDPETRTVGLDVVVKDSYRNVRPGIRPPLVKDMYVEVEIRGAPLASRLVVPRSALHEGRLYVVDGDGRLEARTVEVAFAQSTLACIESGLAAGERVVLTDLLHATEGMLLEPTPDAAAAAALARDAAGGEGAR